MRRPTKFSMVTDVGNGVFLRCQPRPSLKWPGSQRPQISFVTSLLMPTPLHRFL